MAKTAESIAAKSEGQNAVGIFIEALIGVIMGFVLYITVANIAPELVAQFPANGSFAGQALIQDVGVLLLSIASFILGFLLPFLVVAAVSGRFSS